MVDIPTTPIFNPITRVEATDVALGGALTSTPNKQYQQLGNRDEALSQQINGTQVAISGEATPITSLEGEVDQTIDLNTLFTAGSGTTLTYEITYNSDNDKVTTSIASNILTLSFPIWTTDTSIQVANVTIHVTAIGSSGGRAMVPIRVAITNLNSLFVTQYFGMDYIAATGAAAIFVDAAERAAILADPNLNVVFQDAFQANPVFTVITDVGTIPALALSTDVIVPVTRFRFVGGALDGSYLYTIEPETTSVGGNPDFVNEGIAFYAYHPINTNRAQNFRRYRWTGRQPDGDYVYGITYLPPTSTDISKEGDLVRVFEAQ